MEQNNDLRNTHTAEYELIAKTFMGLEPVLAKELTQLGANNVQIGRRMVSFTGNKEMMYRANFQLHTAIRILKPIRHFKAKSADDVYEEIKKIDWTQFLEPEKTFAVDSVVFSEEFRHSKFVSYKVKDAIVDFFREKKRIGRGCTDDSRFKILHHLKLFLGISGAHRDGHRTEFFRAVLEADSGGPEAVAGGDLDAVSLCNPCGFITALEHFTPVVDILCGIGNDDRLSGRAGG